MFASCFYIRMYIYCVCVCVLCVCVYIYIYMVYRKVGDGRFALWYDRVGSCDAGLVHAEPHVMHVIYVHLNYL